MRPGPANAHKLIAYHLKVDDPPVRARDLLLKICLAEGWFASKEEAIEKSESWEGGFLTRIRNEINALHQLGRFCLYALNSSSENMIQGAAFVEPSDIPEIVAAKNSRARHVDYVDALAGLSPTEFESLCAGLLTLLGVHAPSLTRRSGDEGIDFFGKLELHGVLAPNPTFSNVAQQMSVWLIGQAKHYQAVQVSTPDLRDLIGAIELAKFGAHVGKSPQLGDNVVRLCDPIYYLFFTTGRISADAWKLTNKAGAICMDGEMIASFLADNNVGVVGSDYNNQEFCKWVSGFS